MATKTTRGVQQTDVWASADALIAVGEKPTIERVRQHMGRGSPNTITPLLDAWFATLGARLGVRDQVDGQGSLPASLRSAATVAVEQLWQEATTLALDDLAALRSKALDDIERMRAELAECQSQLAAVHHAHEKTIEQLQSSETERHRLAGQLQAAEVHQAGLSTRLEARELALQTLLQQAHQTKTEHQRALDALQQTHAAQIKDAGQRAQDDLHKQLLEVDRVRTANAALERKLETQRERAEATETRLQQEVLGLTAARGVLESQLQGADVKATALEQQLEALRAELVEANTRTQLVGSARDAAQVRLQVLEEWKSSLSQLTATEHQPTGKATSKGAEKSRSKKTR